MSTPRNSDLPAQSDPDIALMLAFAAGRQDAFIELYQRYRDRIVTFTHRMLHDHARAEDAAQEVFLKLYRARSSYKPQSRFSTFLYRIAANHCLNLCARADFRSARTDDVDSAGARGPSQLRQLEHRQLRAALESAFGKLPDRQRAAFLLVHYEGLSYREAAEAIAVSEAALKALIHRARGSLAAELGPLLAHGEEDEYAV